MGMGEKSKGQWECAINRINPQTTPQLPTLLNNEKLPNEPISDFELRSVHQEVMPICVLANPKNEPISAQSRRPVSPKSLTKAEALAKAVHPTESSPIKPKPSKWADVTNVKSE